MEKQEVKRGSLLGGVLLIAGSAIGGGMLGLPIVTGIFGFYPAITIFFFCWIFMTLTALLLLEVNLSFTKNINLITMTEKYLGQTGKIVCWATYLFLFYSALVAYIDASGSMTQSFINAHTNFQVQYYQSALFFTALFGLVVYLGTLFVDRLNRLFMFGLIISYFFLIGFGAPDVSVSHLNHQMWLYSFLAIPVTITSFGYHNIIPTLTNYLKRDRSRMIQMIVIGGAFPLLVYILWDWLLLGVVPTTNFTKNITLENMLSFIQFSFVATLAKYFAFFAIVTSFLAQAMALVDFLRDALKVSNNWFNRIWVVILVLAPPYIFAMIYPGIFIKALGLVGGFGAIILFVFLPVLMVWKLRYVHSNKKYQIVPGGKWMLSLILLVGLAIMLVQFMQEFFNFKIFN